MSIRIIRDLNDNPGATETWRAALAECPPIDSSNHQRWCVAWGCCYASLTSGVRPIAWDEDKNTDTDGVEWFDSLETANDYLDDIEEASDVCSTCGAEMGNDELGDFCPKCDKRQQS